MEGGEEDESSEGDGMIYFFFSSPLFCAEGKGRELWYKIGMWVEGTMCIVQILFISLVLLFFSGHYLTISFFYLPGIQQQHNHTQVKRLLRARSLFFSHRQRSKKIESEKKKKKEKQKGLFKVTD